MTSIPKGKNIMWTAEMDSVLIKVLYDEAVSGNMKADNGWKPASQQHVVAQVSVVSECAPQAKYVRSRLKTMKKEYSCAKVCLDLSGFTFNPETKLIEGDDIAWADYLRAYPKSFFSRTKMLPFYDEMVMIFGKDMANGSGHVEAHDETETEGELLPRDLLDDIDDTEIEIEEDPCWHLAMMALVELTVRVFCLIWGLLLGLVVQVDVDEAQVVVSK